MAVITISRQYGAGGITLGEMLAEKLGYMLFDNELIQRVAESANVSSKGVVNLEKQADGKFQRFIAGFIPVPLIERVREKADVGLEDVYVDILRKVIGNIADEGNAVIIGRGAQYILKDLPDTIHLLVTANRSDRVKFLMRKHSLSEEDAKRAIELDDRRRSNLYSKFGRSDYDTPMPYHLVFNFSRTPFDKACEIVCQLVNADQ